MANARSKHKRLMLKQHPELGEKWVQARIASDPALLGLGEVDVKDMERVQPHGGRLDLLLHDTLANTRYEVELQLGATDESHIIRTIEYWDTERRRWPQYEHVAVIIAEEITARFFNVISLFNGFIPIIRHSDERDRAARCCHPGLQHRPRPDHARGRGGGEGGAS